MDSIQWVNVSDGSIITSQHLRFMIVPSSKDTMYRCDIRDGEFTESETITIGVGGKYVNW